MKHHFSISHPSAPGAGRELPDDKGFTLVELLVVLGVMAIILAIVSPLVPSLLRANQFDSNVNTLSGVLEEAREAATAGNTYIWVAFTDPVAAAPGNGIWVATIQSQDGTDSGINSGTATVPNWQTALTFPGTTFLLHSKVQNLPGVEIIGDPAAGALTLSTINGNIAASATAKTPQGPIPPAYVAGISIQGGLGWTVSTLANVNTGGATAGNFNHAIEFTPNGEAHVQAWNANIQFGVVPTVGTGAAQTNNAALFNISRLTGKTTVYRM
jgi:prepilin-type N-terminal cleavage/methylation domain-containing protein